MNSYPSSAVHYPVFIPTISKSSWHRFDSTSPSPTIVRPSIHIFNPPIHSPLLQNHRTILRHRCSHLNPQTRPRLSHLPSFKQQRYRITFPTIPFHQPTRQHQLHRSSPNGSLGPRRRLPSR